MQCENMLSCLGGDGVRACGPRCAATGGRSSPVPSALPAVAPPLWKFRECSCKHPNHGVDVCYSWIHFIVVKLNAFKPENGRCMKNCCRNASTAATARSSLCTRGWHPY